MSAPSISVLFPAYNDAGTIASMVVTARMTAAHLTDDFEIIVVNDGSQDHTAEVLTELAALIPELILLHHPTNRGYGAALRTGFAAASKDLIFYTDGDAQFDPREMQRLLREMEDGVDYVNGYRIQRADPFFRVSLGRPYHWLIRHAFGLRLRDVDCDFRLFRRSVVQNLTLYESNGAFCIELLKNLQDAGYRFREASVNHYPRIYGRSQYYTLRRVLRAYGQLLSLWSRLVVRKSHLYPLPSPQGEIAGDEP